MVPPPLCFSAGKYFESRIRTCHVGRWCVPGVCAATPSRHATYACLGVVMRLLRSSLHKGATRVHIILTNLRQRRCPVSWTLLVVIIPLNFHPGLCSFTSTRARPFGVRGHDHLTLRSLGVPLRVWHNVLPALRVRGKLDVLPTSGSTLFRVGLLSSSLLGTFL